MQVDDVNVSAIRTALRDMPREFRTKDISEHDVVMHAHRLFNDESQYHAIIGRALSYNRVALGLRLLPQNANKRGALWQKV